MRWTGNGAGLTSLWRLQSQLQRCGSKSSFPIGWAAVLSPKCIGLSHNCLLITPATAAICAQVISWPVGRYREARPIRGAVCWKQPGRESARSSFTQAKSSVSSVMEMKSSSEAGARGQGGQESVSESVEAHPRLDSSVRGHTLFAIHCSGRPPKPMNRATTLAATVVPITMSKTMSVVSNSSVWEKVRRA